MRNKLLIVTTEKRLELNKNGLIVNGDNTRALSFWQRYLDVFDKVIIVARVEKKNKIQSENLVEKFGQIEVFCLTNYQGLKEGLMKRSVIAAEINNLLSTYPNAYFLLRIPGFISNLIASKLIKNRMNYSVEVVGDPYDVFSTQNGPLSKILAWQSRRILKRNLYYAISAAYVTASSLQQRYPFVGFQTYYSSINLSESFFNYNKIFINEPKLSIIGIGSLEMPYKGVDILLASLKLLSKRNIPFSLTWLGGGSLMSSYKTIAQDYGLVKDVHFTGSVTNAEIPKYLNNNNIFLLPSKTEGLPRAMIEAMASGLICLGSNVGGIPELLNNECLFSCNDPKQLADKLDFVYNNFENFKKYSNINIEKAKEYLPDILKKRRIKFYESLLMN